MTDFEIKENYSQICNLLASRELKPAFDKFEKLISGVGLGEYRVNITTWAKLQIHA